MSDTEIINWLERTGASVAGVTGETLIPTAFGVCVGRVTGWHLAPTLREAVRNAANEVKQQHVAMEIQK